MLDASDIEMNIGTTTTMLPSTTFIPNGTVVTYAPVVRRGQSFAPLALLLVAVLLTGIIYGSVQAS